MYELGEIRVQIPCESTVVLVSVQKRLAVPKEPHKALNSRQTADNGDSY